MSAGAIVAADEQAHKPHAYWRVKCKPSSGTSLMS